MNALTLTELIDDLNGQIAVLTTLRDSAVESLKEAKGERHEEMFMGWTIRVEYSASGGNWHFDAETEGSGTYGGGCPTRREAIRAAKEIVLSKDAMVRESNEEFRARQERRKAGGE